MKVVTKRQLAARFVDSLGQQPLADLAGALVAAACEAGYDDPAELGSLVSMVEYELQARRGAVEIRLTTAHELEPNAVEELADKIAKDLDASSHTTLHHVDPELVGGFEAIAGDSVVRGSVRAGLKALGEPRA